MSARTTRSVKHDEDDHYTTRAELKIIHIGILKLCTRNLHASFFATRTSRPISESRGPTICSHEVIVFYCLEEAQCWRRRIRASSSSIIQRLNVGLPLANIRTQDAAIVRQQAVHLSLNISGLSPDTTAAGVHPHLVEKLSEQKMTSIVPCSECRVELVGLVDCVDCFLDVPEVVDRNIEADAAELSLDSDAAWIIWA